MKKLHRLKSNLIPHPHTEKQQRKCVVCSASVHNMNPLGNTCDSTCTRARNAKRTRPEQIVVDIRESEQRAQQDDWMYQRSPDAEAVDSLNASLRHAMGDDYNQPA